jgi:hypothetical protein
MVIVDQFILDGVPKTFQFFVHKCGVGRSEANCATNLVEARKVADGLANWEEKRDHPVKKDHPTSFFKEEQPE